MTNTKLPLSRPSRHRYQASSSSSSNGGTGNNGNDSSTSSSSSGNDSDNFWARSGRGSWVTVCDLYELLGVERASLELEIKAVYRSLQERCHHDVADVRGHDMAIVLNKVYSFLPDPAVRLDYDQEQAKQSKFLSYMGRLLYSAWFGGEGERRVVFVDEVRCIGCLKCTLYVNKTLTAESVYGRARVIAQWANAEDKILDAIQTCPIDCI